MKALLLLLAVLCLAGCGESSDDRAHRKASYGNTAGSINCELNARHCDDGEPPVAGSINCSLNASHCEKGQRR